MKPKAFYLRIYVARHCQTCRESLRLAAEIRQRYKTVQVETVELTHESRENPDDIFSVPTWLLNGRTIALGNPSLDEFAALLSSLSGMSQ